MSTLQVEARTYEECLQANLKDHAGEYVVITGDRVVNFSPSYEAALDWAYDKFGLDGSFFL
jgi:hypothetical protein